MIHIQDGTVRGWNTNSYCLPYVQDHLLFTLTNNNMWEICWSDGIDAEYLKFSISRYMYHCQCVLHYV